MDWDILPYQINFMEEYVPIFMSLIADIKPMPKEIQY